MHTNIYGFKNIATYNKFQVQEECCEQNSEWEFKTVPEYGTRFLIKHVKIHFKSLKRIVKATPGGKNMLNSMQK